MSDSTTNPLNLQLTAADRARMVRALDTTIHQVPDLALSIMFVENVACCDCPFSHRCGQVYPFDEESCLVGQWIAGKTPYTPENNQTNSK